MSHLKTIFDTLDNSAKESEFSGTIRVTDASGATLASAYGLADRANNRPNTEDTRFSVASITKGFTAATIGALIDSGVLSMDTKVRSILGEDLPLIDDRVTVGQLLAHTSGIGDYLDEDLVESFTDYVMTVPVHTLDKPENYLTQLSGHDQVSEPGEQFAYNNAGYCVLALVAERAAGKSFYDLVQEKVFIPSGMSRTAFDRSDEPSAGQAVGYLFTEGLRTNVLHLPVRGNGDGGVVTTTQDLDKFWRALLGGKLVSASTLALLTEPLVTDDDEESRYGRGFYRGWKNDVYYLEGGDAGISARSWYDPSTGVTASVLANDTETAWPVIGELDWDTE